MKKITIILFSAMLMTSCFELNQEDETADGLKAALNVGTQYAVGTLGERNGFYGSAREIGLPLNEQQMRLVNSSSLVKPLVANTIESINRSAEDAVSQVGDIFVEAIKEMTISEAMDILFGAPNAATNYLRVHTGDKLIGLFAGIINESLDKPIVGKVSTNVIWGNFVSAYNLAGIVAQWPSIPDATLGEYVTAQAFDALFLKIEEKEIEIRNNFGVGDYSPLIQRVFGQLKNRPTT